MCPIGAELIHAQRHGRTDRHDEVNSRFPLFCEHAKNRLSCKYREIRLGEDYSLVG